MATPAAAGALRGNIERFCSCDGLLMVMRTPLGGNMPKRSPNRGRGDSSRRRDDVLRQEIAHEAARILATEQSKNFQNAKQKAALRLGIRDAGCLPGNDEVEFALRSYQSLFQANTQPLDLLKLRSIALEAMVFFQGYTPRLMGSVLRGTAMRGSTVTVHLFCDNAEEVAISLLEGHIPYHLSSSRFVINNNSTIEFPTYCFVVDDVPVEATVFPLDQLREPPRTTVDGDLIERATVTVVELLIREATAEQASSAKGYTGE